MIYDVHDDLLNKLFDVPDQMPRTHEPNPRGGHFHIRPSYIKGEYMVVGSDSFGDTTVVRINREALAKVHKAIGEELERLV